MHVGPNAAIPEPDPNLYTVRVYKPPLQAVGERVAIFCLSLLHPVYIKVSLFNIQILVLHNVPDIKPNHFNSTQVPSRLM